MELHIENTTVSVAIAGYENVADYLSAVHDAVVKSSKNRPPYMPEMVLISHLEPGIETDCIIDHGRPNAKFDSVLKKIRSLPLKSQSFRGLEELQIDGEDMYITFVRP